MSGHATPGFAAKMTACDGRGGVIEVPFKDVYEHDLFTSGGRRKKQSRRIQWVICAHLLSIQHGVVDNPLVLSEFATNRKRNRDVRSISVVLTAHVRKHHVTVAELAICRAAVDRQFTDAAFYPQ